MLNEELVSIDSGYDVDWNVWSFMLEASMYIDVSIHRPASMAESLNRVKFVPL